MTPDVFPTPLVTTEWLARHLGEPGLVIVDASWYLAAMNRNGRAEYGAGHIPGAVYWDLDELSDRRAALPHMLPEPGELGRAIGMLGIGNDSRVVVYDGSGANLSAPRVWWMLRVAGHDATAVLDGGLKKWKAEERPLVAGHARWAPRDFEVRWRPEMVRSMEETRAASATKSHGLLDARSRGRFAATEPEPRAGLRGGHIPGARNLPFAELVQGDGTLRPASELKARFSEAGVDLTRPIVVSCGSGVTACALGLGLEVLGKGGWAVYDGSWSEWGRPEGPPLETGS